MFRLSKFAGRFRFKTFRSKLIFSFLVLIIIPITLSTSITYAIFENMVRDKLSLGCQMAMSQAKVNVERVFNDVLTTSESIIRNRDIQRVFKEVKTEYYQQGQFGVVSVSDAIIINDAILTAQTTTLNFYANNVITLIDTTGRAYTSAKVANPNEEYEKVIQKLKIRPDRNYSIWIRTSGDIVLPGATGGQDSILMARAYINLDSFEKLGDLIICIPLTKLSEILGKMVVFEGVQAYIIDSKGIVISSTEVDSVDKPLEIITKVAYQQKDMSNLIMYPIKSDNCTLNLQPVGWFGWKVVQVLPDNVLFSEISYNRNILIAVNVAFFLLFLGMSYLISGSISRPIKNLSIAAKKIATGSFDVSVYVKEDGEIKQLADDFNYMTVELENLINKVNEDEKIKRDLELQVLYAQINPHFLFNTLSSIKSVADACSVPNISRLIVGLSNLLYNSLIKKNEYITIREEIENVKNYVFIQKFRYMKVFEELYDIPETVMDCKTLKFILQPVVENSIIHGFEGMVVDGVIKISAVLMEDRIKIVISDNGAGMSSERIQTVLSGMDPGKGNFSGIGVANVNRRLQLHFGDDFGLVMSSRKGQGTVTEIYIPLLR